MKTLLVTTCLLALAGSAAATAAAEMGSSAGYDLDALWTRAQALHDLAREDAVLLLEGRRVEIDADGAVATTVHRVVWIGSSRGIRSYADLRVPWNSATSTLDVQKLRTWRDGRWWPDAERISETAVVHTLPRALARADDYTSIRETMLLHDGVELPCIMETMYTITERGPLGTDGLLIPPRGIRGASGVFVFPKRDPAVRVELQVSAVDPKVFQSEERHGAPAPVEAYSGNATTRTWALEPVPALKAPVTGTPTLFEPSVFWTTTGFKDVRSRWSTGFTMAARADDEVWDEVQKRLHTALGFRAQVAEILEFVSESVRTVRYDDRVWRYDPRPAYRTWNTGYGHELDRTVLLVGLLQRRGYETDPRFVGRCGFDANAEHVAFLDGDLYLLVQDPNQSPREAALAIDIADGTLRDRSFGESATVVSMIGIRELPMYSQPYPSRFTISSVLEPAEEGAWKGRVLFDTSGCLSLHGRVVATDDAWDEVFAPDVAAIIEGTTLAATRPVQLSPLHTVIAGEIGLPAAEEDVQRWIIASPAAGLLAALPSDVNLADEVRASPVLLDQPLEQILNLRVKLENRRPLGVPATLDIENEVGRITAKTAIDDGWLTYSRHLRIRNATIEPAQWPELRALLLEEADAANGTIVLEAPGD